MRSTGTPWSCARTALLLLLVPAGVATAAAQDTRGLRNDPFALPAALRAPAPATPSAATATGSAARQTAVATAAAATPAPPTWQPRLTAAIVGSGAALVLVDGSVVELGQVIAGHKLVRVDEHSAAFVAKDGTTIEIRMDSAGRVAARP